MEQHLYTYLNQKYGLKSLIVEHASAVIRASNKYEAVDNDVAVIVKMLRYVTLKAVDGEVWKECALLPSDLAVAVGESLEVAGVMRVGDGVLATEPTFVLWQQRDRRGVPARAGWRTC